MPAHYIFRMDDICETMHWGKFNALMSIFRQYNVVPLLGVVPQNIDPFLKVDEENLNFWHIIRALLDEDRIEVAQHGTYHDYVSSSKGILARTFGFPARSEFSGLPYREQKEKLHIGKRLLERHGIFSNVFMAPSHSYDEATLAALKDLGFTTVTDGVALFPYRERELLFVPQIHWSPKAHTRGVCTICLHGNEMSFEQIDNVKTFLYNNSNAVIRFSEASNYLKPYSPVFAWSWGLKYKVMDKNVLPALVRLRNLVWNR